MAPPLPIEPGDLLAHAGWMRALAGSLVNDSASADDVVQESMVAALRRPPQSGRPLEAWLSRVVRNVASNFRRGERRQSERRARIDALESPANPAETIERLDTQRRIVELVRELDEPERSTIVLRYFEGLISEEIGRRMGVNDATVRWRLQKALDQLRARLQRDFGSREAWCAVLAPLAHSFKVTGIVVAGTSAAAGAIVMGTASKVVVVAMVIAGVVGGLWLSREQQEPVLRTAEAAAPVVTPKPEAPLPVAPTTAPAREPVAAESGPAASKPISPVAAAQVAAVAHSPAHVRARFVDTTGQPWARVNFHESDSGEPSTTSGPDGRAELTLDKFRSAGDQVFQFAASREACATRSMRATVAPGQVLDLGEVVLERECRIRGIVHDAQGAGLPDITVGLAPTVITNSFGGESDPGHLRRHGSNLFDRSIVAHSDARGAFDLRGIPAGNWRVWGNREGRGYGVSEPFELHAGDEKIGVDFEVPALLVTDSIQGKVIDPSGQGVPEANLTLSYESDHESGTSGGQTKQDGTFEFLVQLDVPSDLVASDKEHRWADASAIAIPPGARGLILQLLDPSAQPKARLRVHGPGNEAVREIKLESRAGKQNSYQATALTTRELEPGAFEFQVPTAAFGLTVAAVGYLDSGLIKFDPASFSAETEVALAVAPVLHGRVIANGALIAGAVVEAKRALEKNSDLTFNGFPCLMAPHEQEHATCGADGAFSLMLQGEKSVYLRCTAPGFAASVVGPIEVDNPPALIEIELNVGGSIEGRVHAKDGSTVVGAIVGVTCGDGHPRTMRSGLDGRFRFEGLSTGKWLVLERDAEFRTDSTTTMSSDKEAPIHWSCDVIVGRTTDHDLQLQH